VHKPPPTIPKVHETNGQACPPDPREEILAALRVLYLPEQVVELRVPNYPRGNSTAAGYFDDSDALADWALHLSGKAPAVYVTLNEIDPALLARIRNRVEHWVKHTTTDADVLRRRWLPLDFDPVQPAGIPSTDAEHEAALERARRCRSFLSSLGWPEPVEANSGNGAHLLYALGLPNDEPSKTLVEGCLKTVARRFDDATVSVDTAVGNAARIWKLYGTVAAKGDGTDDRPHRRARLLLMPARTAPVTVEQLEALAAEAGEPPPPSSSGHGEAGKHRLNIPRWLEARGVKFSVKRSTGKEDRTIYRITCPFDPSHADASVMQAPDGQLSAKCFHNSCADKGWAEFKAAIGPPATDHFDPPLRERVVSKEAKPHRPLPPYRPFPLKALPEPFRGYAEAAADAIGCDLAFIAVPLLPVLGAAVGNSRRIELKKGWTEPAVIWATVVSPSGTFKSPGLDAALVRVRELQDVAVADWQQAMAAHKEKDDEGPSPVCKRYLTADPTVEALAALLRENPRGLLLARDELNGWLASMDAYKSGKGGDLAHYLERHRAGQLLVDRKTGPRPLIHVPRTALCVVGTTQPETFRRALGREHFEDDLLPRFLPVMPPRKARKWTERTVAADLAKSFAEGIDRLYVLGFDPSSEGSKPTVLRLSPEAKEVWVAFYDRHGGEQLDLDGDLAAAWSKLEGYCARLALVIELASWTATPLPPKGMHRSLSEFLAAGRATPLSAQSVEAAVELVEWFGYEARRVYALLGDVEEDRELHRLTDWIRARGGAVTANELRRSGHRAYRGRPEEAEAALERLAAAGVGEWVWVEPSPRGGRPTRRFRLGPDTKP
jgi:hypothetical protein